MANMEQIIQDEKLIIRSILLTSPQGFQLSKFCEAYKQTNGQTLPYNKLGFTSAQHFLQSLPDVVDITYNSRLQDYLLTGIADKKTMHIEKLVSKQKISKQNKLLAPRSRFAKKLPSRHTSFTPRPPMHVPFAPRVTKLTPIPPRSMKQPLIPSGLVKQPPILSKIQNKAYAQSSTTAHLPPSVKIEIIKLLKKYGNWVSLSDFLTDYRRTYEKELNFQNYGFSKLQLCLTTIKELRYKVVENVVYLCVLKENQQFPEEKASPVLSLERNLPQPLTPNVTDMQYYSRTHLQTMSKKPLEENNPSSTSSITKSSLSIDSIDQDIFISDDSSTSSFSKLSDVMKMEFRQVLELNPHGLWAEDFPGSYEIITGNTLDLDELGFSKLEELFSSLPDIFSYRPPEKCNCDFLLFDARVGEEQSYKDHSGENKNIADIRRTIGNIRKMLQDCPEGLFLNNFLNVYNQNFAEALILSKFGFDKLEKFLNCIADLVPLRISHLNAHINVKLGQEITPSFVHTKIACWKTSLRKKIPNEIVKPGMNHASQLLPSDPDTYFPISVIRAADPDLMWIQLVGEKTSESLDALIDEIDDFYIGPYGDLYVMQERDIVSGLVCAAVWPSDGSWQRVNITNVPSHMDYVTVLFIDQGSIKKVFKRNMRYLRKEFLELPAQAIKARLALIKPKQHHQWCSSAKERLSNFCHGKILMAKFLKMTLASDCCNLWLRDNHESDSICLNEVLVTEGLADYFNQYTSKIRVPQSVEESVSNEADEDNLTEIAGVTESDLKQALSTILKMRASESVASNEQLLDKILHSLNIDDESCTGLRDLLCAGLNSSVVCEIVNDMENVSISGSNCNSEFVAEGDISCETYSNDASQISISSNNYSSSLKTTSSDETSQHGNKIQSSPSNRFDSNCVDRAAQSTISSSNSAPGVNSASSSLANSLFESDASSDIPQIDDDTLLDQQSTDDGVTPRYVQRINLRDRYKIHIIVLDRNLFVPSGDVSSLLWPHAKHDYLPERLRGNIIELQKIRISETDHPDIFLQMNSYTMNKIDYSPTIFLYPIKSVLGILNIFGHPSATIRDEILEEIRNFDPDDEIWKHFSKPEYDDPQDDTNCDDFYKMSVYDLQLIAENLHARRKEALQEMSGLPKTTVEETAKKIDFHIEAVEKRIKQIKNLSTAFYLNETNFSSF